MQEHELIIGLVSAVGTNTSQFVSLIMESLRRVNFGPVLIRVGDQFRQLGGYESLPDKPIDLRLREHMRIGTELRDKCQRGDAAALLAVRAVSEKRDELQRAGILAARRAFVLHQLKHPDEVKILRDIYGSSFVLAAAYTPRGVRRENLIMWMRDENESRPIEECGEVADALITRDEAEAGTEFGQNVRATFPLADVFFNASDPAEFEREVVRFIDLLFDCSFSTPTRDEFAMFHAEAAAFRSSCLSRQVGAVITTQDGDIVAVGTNEVPKAGGGSYWEDDVPDQRDFQLGYDAFDIHRRALLVDVLERLLEGKLLVASMTKDTLHDLIGRTLDGEHTPLAGAKLMDLVEFVRAVHAEMAALLDACRRGIPTRGCTLYTTTFPCHDCAKHIVAAGIRRVVYIQPHPKSLALELHGDAIALGPTDKAEGTVKFEPFVGVAPRRYVGLFGHSGKRKDRDGKIVLRDRFVAIPRSDAGPWTHLSILAAERHQLDAFNRQLLAHQLLQERADESTRLGGK